MWGDRLPRSQVPLLILLPLPPIKTVKGKVAKVSNKQKINVERFSVKNSRSLSQFGQWLCLSLSPYLSPSLCVCVGWLPVWEAWQQALTLWQQHTLPAFQMKNDSAWLESRRIASRRLELTLMPPNQSRDKGGRLKCGYSQGKQRQHCIDVAHVALGFPPLSPTAFPTSLFVIRKVSRGFVLYFPPSRFAFPSHVSKDSFIHSLPQSWVLFGFVPSVPLCLRLCLFLCSSWLDFYFIFISISMKATCGRSLGHLSNFQSHIWRCHACVLFPAPHTLTVPIPQEKTYRKRLFRATQHVAFAPWWGWLLSTLRVHFNKKGKSKKLRRNARGKSKKKILKEVGAGLGTHNEL